MKETLLSGKSSFKIEVPYKLIESGDKGKKPLIIYLHGYGEHLDYFESKTEPLTNLHAYHLYIQGPYPIYDRSRDKKVEEWGRAWYLYDGRQQQFIKSLEISSEFIQEIVDGLLEVIDVERIAVFGYSMGGYLAGYFALSRWKHVHECIGIGCRFKTEVFEDKLSERNHIGMVAIHGKNDNSVYPEPQKKEINRLSENGYDAEFVEVDAGHELDDIMITASENWLKKRGYKAARV